MILVNSLDDIYDALDRCREMAFVYPEIDGVHEPLAFFPNSADAHQFCFNIDMYFATDERISTSVEKLGNGHYGTYLIYRLNADELDEAFAAMEDYFDDVDGLPQLDPNNPADAELLEEARKVIQKMQDRGELLDD